MSWICKWRGHKWLDETNVQNRRYRLDHCKRCPALRIFDRETGREYSDS